MCFNNNLIKSIIILMTWHQKFTLATATAKQSKLIELAVS